MSGRTAGRARFALALKPKLLARRDAGGNLDRDLSLARDTTRSAAGLARLLPRNLNRRLGAARRFVERDLQVVPEIGAALRTAAAPRAAEEIAEAEQITEAA